MLRQLHTALGARFSNLNGVEVIADYGQVELEARRIAESAAILDLSARGRLCLTGADRVRFLHGQVTNDIKRLRVGEGCYAALVTAKGKMQSDLNVYCLADELLLDFEPGLSGKVVKRLEQYLVADDVQVIDVASHYGLLSVQGPRSRSVLEQMELFKELPGQACNFTKTADPTLGEIYVVLNYRTVNEGFDIFVPVAAREEVLGKLQAAASSVNGGLCGWTALETARIEAGIARYGQDMDENCFPQECGIEQRAVSYSKGCYIGQEVLNRLHTMGHVNRQLRGLKLDPHLQTLPGKGDKLMYQGKEAGMVTSAARSPLLSANIALGFVRREWNAAGTVLTLRAGEVETEAEVADLPFARAITG